MIIGLFDVILTDEQLPVLTQTNEFLLREEVTISRPDILVDLLNQLFCLKYRAYAGGKFRNETDRLF